MNVASSPISFASPRAASTAGAEKSRPVTRAPRRAPPRGSIPKWHWRGSNPLPPPPPKNPLRSLKNAPPPRQSQLRPPQNLIPEAAVYGRLAFRKLLSEVFYRYRFDRVGEFEAEDARVEIQLAVQGPLDVLGSPEAVLLALEGYVGDGESLLLEGREHLLGLLFGHHLIFEALEEDHRAGESSGGVDRRALHVEVSPPGVGPDQAVEVARLELVGLPGQGLHVADSEVARAGGERIPESERAERRVTARAAAGDHQSFAVNQATLGQVNCSVGAVVDVDDTPRTFEVTTVFPPVARAPAVVHVEHGDAAAGPVLDPRIKGPNRRRRRSPGA